MVVTSHEREYSVYILTNRAGTVLYTGVTNDLERRVEEHRAKQIPGFAAKYNATKLVFYETTLQVDEALAREKQIKGWTRAKKIALIQSMNPTWSDLSEEW